jgi:hypothetical protein
VAAKQMIHIRDFEQNYCRNYADARYKGNQVCTKEKANRECMTKVHNLTRTHQPHIQQSYNGFPTV